MSYYDIENHQWKLSHYYTESCQWKLSYYDTENYQRKLSYYDTKNHQWELGVILSSILHNQSLTLKLYRLVRVFKWS